MKYTEIFSSVKIEKIHWKKFDILNIYAQNIDCGYKLELPQQGGSNEYPQSVFDQKMRNILNPSVPVLLFKSGV